MCIHFFPLLLISFCCCGCLIASQLVFSCAFFVPFHLSLLLPHLFVRFWFPFFLFLSVLFLFLFSVIFSSIVFLSSLSFILWNSSIDSLYDADLTFTNQIRISRILCNDHYFHVSFFFCLAFVLALFFIFHFMCGCGVIIMIAVVVLLHWMQQWASAEQLQCRDVWTRHSKFANAGRFEAQREQIGSHTHFTRLKFVGNTDTDQQSNPWNQLDSIAGTAETDSFRFKPKYDYDDRPQFISQAKCHSEIVSTQIIIIIHYNS